MTKHQIVIAPVYGYALTHQLGCMVCGRDVHIVYRRDMWPLAFWYRHGKAAAR